MGWRPPPPKGKEKDFWQNDVEVVGHPGVAQVEDGGVGRDELEDTGPRLGREQVEQPGPVRRDHLGHRAGAAGRGAGEGGAGRGGAGRLVVRGG